MSDHLSEQAIREAATQYVDDLFRQMDMLDSEGDRRIVEFSDEQIEQAFADGMQAQLAEHPNATDWQNRSERAEQEAAELRGHDAFYLATALMAAQRKIDALQQHAEAMAEALDDAEAFIRGDIQGQAQADGILRDAQQALAAHAARKIDG